MVLPTQSQNLRHRHTIEEDGYNSGRDDLVAAAMQGGRFGDRLWKADVEWVGGMLPVGSDGINHGIEIDGITAVLTVQSESRETATEQSIQQTDPFVVPRIICRTLHRVASRSFPRLCGSKRAFVCSKSAGYKRTDCKPGIPRRTNAATRKRPVDGQRGTYINPLVTPVLISYVFYPLLVPLLRPRPRC